MNILYCGLNDDEFNRISSCRNAKEIRHILEVTHEGTSQVKESKIGLVMHKYGLFKISESESTSEMFNRFMTLLMA